MSFVDYFSPFLQTSLIPLAALRASLLGLRLFNGITPLNVQNQLSMQDLSLISEQGSNPRTNGAHQQSTSPNG